MHGGMIDFSNYCALSFDFVWPGSDHLCRRFRVDHLFVGVNPFFSFSYLSIFDKKTQIGKSS